MITHSRSAIELRMIQQAEYVIEKTVAHVCRDHEEALKR